MSNTELGRISREALTSPWDQAWDTLNALTGEPAFVEVMANAPELLDFAMSGFYQRIFFSGRVAERYKQLAGLRPSLAHGCRSCNLQNTPGTRAAGITEDQLSQVEGPDREAFNAADRAVLELSEQMVLTNSAGRLGPEFYARLRAHFDDAEICELSVVLGFIGGMAKTAFVLDLVEKEDFCPFAPPPSASPPAIAARA